MSTKKFPSFYPTHITVPHQDATAKSFECLYRFAEASPATATDFRARCNESCTDRYRKKHQNNPRFYGTSFFTCKRKLDELQEMHPDGFATKLITNGAVSQELGLSLKETKHVCLWFYEGCFPTGFKV